MDQFLEQLRSLGLSNPEEVHEKMVNEDVTSIELLQKLDIASLLESGIAKNDAKQLIASFAAL